VETGVKLASSTKQELLRYLKGITVGLTTTGIPDLQVWVDVKSLNPQRGDLGVFNIKEEGPGLAFINQKNTLVVRAFDYLREVLAH
jgi:hypothetical protein